MLLMFHALRVNEAADEAHNANHDDADEPIIRDDAKSALLRLNDAHKDLERRPQLLQHCRAMFEKRFHYYRRRKL